jgi:cytosine/adenosine deaminase-related metal-dependent hydrolase
MAYEKVQGDHLFDGDKIHGKDKVLVQDASGRKIDIIDLNDAGDDVQYIPGLVSPGFVNAHCHLELSHMKNVIPPHTGLVPFLVDVVGKRDFPQEVIHRSIVQAKEEMEADGIVAVGDIANTAVTVPYKLGGSIHWQNFIEVLSFTEENTPSRMAHYSGVLEAFNTAGAGRSSLSPHAPYSVSPLAFQMINEATEGCTISIHNQECHAENELYRTGGGDFLNLFRNFGLDKSPFPITGQNSIRSYLPFFNKGQRIILVHNTFMSGEDIQWANELAKKNGTHLVYCFCLNANLYIENIVPPIHEFIREGCEIVLGTDSYSSNHALKISSEIATVRDRYPDIELSEVMGWATLNGAKALGVESRWITGSGIIERLQNRQ